MRILAIACSLWVALAADNTSPAARAYEALKIKDYDEAIRLFREALTSEPNRTDWRKQLAYTLLKTGETEAARDQFSEVVAVDAKDEASALEYAFLCHETKRTQEARRVFARISQSKDSAVKATAKQAFSNIEQPLVAAIERCRRALQANPSDYSAHVDLARAAETRDDPKLAAAHYHAAWKLKPADRDLLVDYGRMARLVDDEEHATAAFLAASRSGAARAAEAARDLLPSRYPYASEFYKAIEFEPGNVSLRRDLAFLFLAVGKEKEAEAEFETLLQIAPNDQLSLAQLGLLRLAKNDLDRAMPMLEKVLEGGNEELAKKVRQALTARQPAALKPREEKPPAPEPKNLKALGDRSYDVGNLNDALRFYRAALEENPRDPEINLKLGYTYNMLKQDAQAIKYFDVARKGADSPVKADASRAFRNIRPSLARFRTTLWTLPIYSTRWHEAFNYGQIKTELKLGKLPFRPYASVRFVGDSQRAAGALGPGYLSESSFIAGIGVATQQWKGLMAWSEAGNAIRYRHRTDIGRMTPDYRGGVSYSHLMGRGIQSESRGFFLENHNDAVYLSRFAWNTLFYTQNKLGYTLPEFRGLQWQAGWNMNYTMDRKREAWANFIDVGPAFRFRMKKMPPSMVLSVDLLRGTYLLQPKNYYDVRIGVWYAQTR